MSKFLFNYSEYKKRIKEADERSKKYFISSIQNSISHSIDLPDGTEFYFDEKWNLIAVSVN